MSNQFRDQAEEHGGGTFRVPAPDAIDGRNPGSSYDDRRNAPRHDERTVDDVSDVSPRAGQDGGPGAGHDGHGPTEPPAVERYNPDAVTLIGDLLQRPTKAFGYLALPKTERLGVGLAVYLLSQLPRTWFQNPFGFQSPALRFVGNAMISLVGLVFAVAILHLSARMLGGRNRYGNMLQAEAMASLPYLLTTPLLLVGVLVGSSVWWNVISGVASIWAFVLSVIAIRAVYSFSTGRAVAALFLPVLLMTGLGFVLALAAATLFGEVLGL